MIGRFDPRAIQATWQHQVDESLEAGATLLLEGGVCNQIIQELPTVIALDELTAARSDTTTSWFLTGGDGVAWVMVVVGSNDVPTWIPLYAGADLITYVASLATIPAPSTHTRYTLLTGLPAIFQSLLLPVSQPGVAPGWSALPFVVVAQSVPADMAANHSSSSWFHWLAFIFVIALILSALFV